MLENPAATDGCAINNESLPENPGDDDALMSRLSQSVELSFIDPNPWLREDPRYEPRLTDELERYLGFLEKVQPRQFRTIEQLHGRLQRPHNGVESLRFIAGMIVDGSTEAGNIYRALAQCARQDLPPEEFEVQVFINIAAGNGLISSSLSTDRLETTVAEVARFQQDWPERPVRAVVRNYGAPKPIGTIRSDAANLAAYDLRQRGWHGSRLLYQFTDADLTYMNRQCFQNKCAAHEVCHAGTRPDVVVGQLLSQKIPGLPLDATANQVLRCFDLFPPFLDNRRSALMTPEPATAVDFATCLAAGGIDRQLKMYEVSSLVEQIRIRRTPLSEESEEVYRPVKLIDVKARHAVTVTDSRRLVAAMAPGYGPHRCWDQNIIPFGAGDRLRAEPMGVKTAEQNAQRA